MRSIKVKSENGTFNVTVSESDGSSSQHSVTIDQRVYQSLTGGSISKEQCIEAAFCFLLDRESKEAILNRFDISVIRDYFPNFDQAFKEYLSS